MGISKSAQMYRCFLVSSEFINSTNSKVQSQRRLLFDAKYIRSIINLECDIDDEILVKTAVLVYRSFITANSIFREPLTCLDTIRHGTAIAN